MNEQPTPVWPRLTQHLPVAIGGVKATPEDFQVEEIPAYLPSGQGEHLFLWVQKRGLSTMDVVKALGRHLKVSEKDIGHAGLKDKQAVTRQFISIPARYESEASSFAHEGVRILKSTRHGNKLKTGHLKGNTFRICVRDVKNGEAAVSVLAHLQTHGAPNYFGLQRFGRDGDNAEMGFALLKNERLARPPDRFLRKLYLSAAQSDLFNESLKRRIEAGTFSRALPGDVLKKEDTGGEFVCEDVEKEQPRVDAKAVSSAGPLFGPNMLLAQGEVGAWEAQLLSERGLTLADFERGRNDTLGARRSYRVCMKNLEYAFEGNDMQLQFSLPPGSYATVILREVFGGP